MNETSQKNPIVYQSVCAFVSNWLKTEGVAGQFRMDQDSNLVFSILRKI